MLGLRLPRLVTTLISVAFLMIAVVLGALYLWSPRATLRITTGPMGSSAQRFISTFVSVSTALHPHIYFKTVPVPDFEMSAKALEDDDDGYRDGFEAGFKLALKDGRAQGRRLAKGLPLVTKPRGRPPKNGVQEIKPEHAIDEYLFRNR